jgi:hypothetical protein
MKNLLNLLLVLFTTMLIVSCSRNGEDTNPEASLIGQWQFTKIGYLSGTNQEQLIPYENGCTTQKDFIEFTTANNYTRTVYSNRSCEPSKEEDFTFSKENNIIKLKVKGEDYWYYYKIISLSGTELKIQKYSDKVMIQGTNLFVLTKK